MKLTVGKKLFFLILLCLLVSEVMSGSIFVCNSCTYSSITTAIEKAQPHDTIIVQPGLYFENDIEINKPLTILGIQKPVIDAQNKGYIIRILSDSVTVSGLVMKNVGSSHTSDYAAIYIHRSEYFIVKNNVMNNVFFGVLVEKSKRGIIEGNVIMGKSAAEFYSGNGIHLWHCNNILVEDNRLSGLRDGIYFEFVDDSRVLNNNSFNNVRYGLHFMFSNNDEYRGNEFKNNGAGVAVMFSKKINMKKNIFKDNWGPSSYGLLLKEIYDAQISENIFENNTIAINVDGSSRINYFNNTIAKNGWAVKVTGGCYKNRFYNNNFISNSFDVSYNSKINDNEFLENYWSEYSGYDLDKNGYGDIPFRPVKLFTYIVNRTPETIVLLRSLFIDIINFSEKVSPVFTPDNLTDPRPSMQKISW